MHRLCMSALFVSFLLLQPMTGSAEDITSNLKLNADFRYRHELIDKDGSEMRNRQRIRARLKLDAMISDNVTVTMQLASGSDDPISTNQTLDGGFSTKGINLDLAYVTWQPTDMEGLTMTGGKVKNPFHAPGKGKLIWDPDLNPEGIAASYDGALGGLDASLSASWFWAEERPADDDTALLGVQGLLSGSVGDTGLMVGAGYFDYTNVRGYRPLYDIGDGFGNSLTPGGLYQYDYNELELFIEMKPAVLDGNVTIFADFVNNIADGADNTTAWLVGASAGSVKDRGDMAFGYSYRRIEADAIIGAFTDSDFCGGGTDGDGHELNFSLGIAPNISFDTTVFLNECGIDSDVAYHRVQTDLKFKL